MIGEKTVSVDASFLRESAINLAENHVALSVITGKERKPIAPILKECKETLTEAYRVLSALAKNQQELSPAAEWLIDNFYIIQEQLVEIEVDFPREYQRAVPALKGGEHAGLPRVYDLVINYLIYNDYLVDPDTLQQYVQNYQQVQPLMLGEIWAIPIMIRFILIQKLAEKSSRVLYRKEVRGEIAGLLQQVDEQMVQEPGAMTRLFSEWIEKQENRKGDPLPLLELYNQLQISGMLLDEQRRWIQYRFRQFDLPLEESMRVEAQKQTRLQVSIQHAVITLRSTTESDWGDFVEACSVVEKILQLDPAGIYPEMDFQTRDHYRRVVERLSRRSGRSESEIAQEILLLTEQALQSNTARNGEQSEKQEKATHVGDYLLGNNYRSFTKKIGYLAPLKEKFHRVFESHPVLYLCSIGLHTALLMIILWLATGTVFSSPWASAAVLLVSFFPALDLSVSAVNRFFAFMLPPRFMPKMEYKSKIPDEARTIVVVPTLFADADEALRQVEKLEVQALANPDPSLQFALLSDFTDADTQTKATDRAIIDVTTGAIRKLNEKYISRYGDKFILLHRERVWNDAQGVWMGWERKRGKLEEFNRLICNGNANTTFTYREGNFLDSVEETPVRYVITLDADTRMPPHSARNLIRTMAHPQNRAEYDPKKETVTGGYAVIQPRISISPETAQKTWFSRIFSGNVGLDPYSTVISDIYQDLNAEAVFTGKGIYDVEAFHRVLEGRFPSNRILSHDLLESTYLKTGLASEIELFDDTPATYDSYRKRNHRWIRGDWQIASWMFPRVPLSDGTSEKNPVNLLSRWKIFDNLRRSLNPFFLTLFFIAGWFFLPGSAWIWTAAAFGILAFPIYVSLSGDIMNRPARVRWKLYMQKVRDNLRINTVQSVSTAIFLPHQAVVQLDAILRTLYRLIISRKNLLEWRTAFHTERNTPNSFGSYLQSMILSVILGAGVLAAAIYLRPVDLWIIGPFAIAWIAAPFYAWKISLPIDREEIPLSDEQTRKLRTYARLTWFYFERFVNEDYSWLPPDNYQEDPPLTPAERTSPTNIGLALVSTQVAYNMGYITLSELLDRLLKTLHSLNQLEKYRGHYYNWYETRLGEVLSPKYISTVDSGNLAASLIVVKEAIHDTMNREAINGKSWDGLRDTVVALRAVFDDVEGNGFLPELSYQKIDQYIKSLINMIENREKGTIQDDLKLLRRLKEDAFRLCAVDLMPLGSRLNDMQMQNLLYWLEAPLRLIEKISADLRFFQEDEMSDFSGYSPYQQLDKQVGEDPKSQSVKLLKKWKKQAEEIAYYCDTMVDDMDFSFLYLQDRGLFSIGYNVEKAQLDKGTYDLLASEARIASYISIAKGDIPVEHWFRLSRRLTSLSKNEILLSWGGTMFEYLMPLLFMRSYPDTMLHHTLKHVIEWQKEYGTKRDLPWGSSESAYNFLNMDMHYQYRAFGAPGLGLKRGLAEEYVIAPYASMLSLMVAPDPSLKNLEALEQLGASGMFGFYDAVDFTRNRMKNEEEFHVVKTYMVHHHGMSMIALENLLNNWSVNNYFHADPRIQGCELILQERIPRGVPIKEPHPIDAELEPGEQEIPQRIVEHAGINELDRSPPRLHLLSNGTFSVMLTHAGTGYSRCEEYALNAWEPDPVSDPLGMFFYIRDLDTGIYWNAMHQPVRRKPDRYDTWFHHGKVVTSRVDEWIETTTTVAVSPEDSMEVRSLMLTNYSQKPRTLDVTSYAEVVLNRTEDHYSHPAFSKLFLQTEYLDEYHSLLVKRRPRAEGESPVWLVHTFAGETADNLTDPLQFETERSAFIGRARSLENPAAMDSGSRLYGSFGNVSDPIVSLRKTIKLGPGEKTEISFGFGFASNREEAVRLAELYHNRQAASHTFDMADVYSSVEPDHIGVTSRQVHYYQKLASWVLYSDPKYRADGRKIRANRKHQHALWAYGISGDLPLIIFRIDQTSQLKHVKNLLKAHAFWRMKGMESELLILNDHPPGYVDEVQTAVQQAVESSPDRDRMNQRGGVYVHRTEKITPEDQTLLLTVAHAVFVGKLPAFDVVRKEDGTLHSWRYGEETTFEPLRMDPEQEEPEGTDESAGLQFFNGFGGFSELGDEYRIILKPDRPRGVLIHPPAPWSNVIANPQFGTLMTESGAGYTWSQNSRENKLTSWSNDPVTDAHSEAFFLRDETSGKFWSPAPGPVPPPNTCRVAHGFGYSRYEVTAEALSQTVEQFVARDEPVKISRIKIKNQGDQTRELSLFRYLDRVLGVQRIASSRFIITEAESSLRAIFSHNHYNNEFSGRTAFASVAAMPAGAEWHFTTNRKHFIGRNRSLRDPKALLFDEILDGNVDIGADPCAAFQVRFSLAPGGQATICFVEGECDSMDAARRLADHFADLGDIEDEFSRVKSFWREKLSAITVQTPDPSLDVMVNGWLMYQNISSRTWARTAFYQAGGAFGFRDQLQDSTALLYPAPELARTQILLHAEHQFKEGDVLHWWHPPTGRGIRSKITDDRLWLPYVAEFYIKSTGDYSILEETVPYLIARKLEEYEHEVYLQPDVDSIRETLYEHCCRAIDISLKFGEHGIPLMGAGDWNDGMNRVGEGGKGESVWLGFFICAVLDGFIPICREQGDVERAEHYEKTADRLKQQLNSEGWDGEWYLRAFYDDGTPLGSSDNEECKIDGISQAWSVISGAAPEDRGLRALRAAEEHLISRENRIIKLLTPPFDATEKNPGYIKGYIPGVRENGGQYTHGALWVIKALAESGQGEKATDYLHMINPVNHSSSPDAVRRYKVEPYVVAADIYGEPPLNGMGGWTWYTGSGGWMYRVAVESVLGFRLEGDTLCIAPSISKEWKNYTIRYRRPGSGTEYEIEVENSGGVETGHLCGELDGKELQKAKNEIRISLNDDGEKHRVQLKILKPEETTEV